MKSIDWSNNNVKLLLAFIVPFVTIFILTPGVFVEVDPKKGASKSNIISYPTTAIHALIMSIILFLFYYFYLSRKVHNT